MRWNRRLHARAGVFDVWSRPLSVCDQVMIWADARRSRAHLRQGALRGEIAELLVDFARDDEYEPG